MRRTLMRAALSAVFACSLGSAFGGLGPHEIVVLVNSRSPRSLEIANHFVHLRRIPDQNVIYLDLPDRVLEPRAELSPAEFTETIWEPAQRIIRERGLDHVLAWVYSVDFPIRITTTPPVSLMGMTFMRNQFPDDPQRVEKGLYASPLFAGPDKSDGPKALGLSLARAREGLGEAMPVPSMMLGYTGSRGTDAETVIRTLRYGQVADRTMPRGTIYWMTGPDVRTQIRAWQFPVVQEEMKPLGIRTEIVSEIPSGRTDIMGVQLGAEWVQPAQVGRMLPGAVAEHLTSFAGEFHHGYQTKMSDWMRAGATASAGAVAEPYSLWTKFPHARFFAHYARGHTLLESFYLSLRSPTQILLVGEPLSRPWSPRLMLTLIALDDMPVGGQGSFYASLMPEVPGVSMKYQFFVDGLPVGEASVKNELTLDTTGLADGFHELRVVSMAPGPIVQSVQQQLGFTARNHGRSVTIRSPASRSEVPISAPLGIALDHEGEPEEIGVMHHERILTRSNDPEDAALEVDLVQIGKGPAWIQGYARYGDGMVVRSEPLRIDIKGETAPVLPDAHYDGVPEIVIEGVTDRVYQVRSLEGALRAPGRFSAQISFPVREAEHPGLDLAGLIFDMQDDKNFRYVALDGVPSAWAVGTVRNGKRQADMSRGRYIPLHVPYDLILSLTDNRTVELYVNHELILRHTLDQPIRSNRIGLLGGPRSAIFVVSKGTEK